MVEHEEAGKVDAEHKAILETDMGIILTSLFS